MPWHLPANRKKHNLTTVLPQNCATLVSACPFIAVVQYFNWIELILATTATVGRCHFVFYGITSSCLSTTAEPSRLFNANVRFPPCPSCRVWHMILNFCRFSLHPPTPLSDKVSVATPVSSFCPISVYVFLRSSYISNVVSRWFVCMWKSTGILAFGWTTSAACRRQRRNHDCKVGGQGWNLERRGAFPPTHLGI